MESLKLYPFQEDALRISKQKWDEGVARQLLALPTGTGKTCIFANLPRYHKLEKRMLVLAHREELIYQARTQFRRWNLDSPLQVGIEMAGSESLRRDKVVVASVNSLGRANSGRLWRFPPDDFDVIVCDEAHHSAAPTYLRVFDHFGLRHPDNRKLLLGVTATPFRADDKELVPGVYQDIIYMMPILQAIEEGWLCDLRSFRIEKTGADLDQVKARADDLAENQLEGAIDNRIRNGLIAKEWKKLAGNRRTLVFAVTVKHARNLAAAFRDYGVTAQAVWGEDPERQAKLRAHRQGVIQVLCNCAVLTEGYDDRRIECIVMARPTLSRVLFVQMIGRGTRIEDGLPNLVEARRNGLPISKPECIVIDVVDNTKKHDLVTLPRLFNSRIDFHGKSLIEVRKQSKPGELTNPYLNSTELQQVERLKARIDVADLFRGARRGRFWDVKGVNSVDSFVLQVEPTGSGYVKAWESSPGRWRIEGRIDGALYDLGAGLTKTEAQSKAHAMASRRIAPPGRWRVKPLHKRQKDLCPFCHILVLVGKLHRHMTTKCPNRPTGLDSKPN